MILFCSAFGVTLLRFILLEVSIGQSGSLPLSLPLSLSHPLSLPLPLPHVSGGESFHPIRNYTNLC